MDNLARMKELLALLAEENDAYYLHDDPIVPDSTYDAQLDELARLEQETGIIFANSPTQKVSGGILPGLKKVHHVEPMLSVDRTKSIQDLEKFMEKTAKEGNPDLCSAYLSWKEDGLTLVATYENGKLTQLATRGGGNDGEDVTHNAGCVAGLPMTIPTTQPVVVRGECVVSWTDFDAFNKTADVPFSHPRNLAAGSVRLLDPAKAKSRPVQFKAFELVKPIVDTKTLQWTLMGKFGFSCVEHRHILPPKLWDRIPGHPSTMEGIVATFDPAQYPFPVDGLILEYEDQQFGRSLGSTGHHDRRKMALKWEDEGYITTFRGVDAKPTRSGTISLTAQFDPVNIDGSNIERATLHNVTFFEALELGEGDTIRVEKRNKIIPAVSDNLTRSGSYKLPTHCPCCGTPLVREKPDQTVFLRCPNKDCAAKHIRKLAHFASKDGMNIVGLSEATLEMLVEAGFVSSDPVSIYTLSQRAEDLKAHFGGRRDKSIDNLLAAIEESRNTTLQRLLVALGIPMMGKKNAKELANALRNDPEAFVLSMGGWDDANDWGDDPDFSDVRTATHRALLQWWHDPANRQVFKALLETVSIRVDASPATVTDGPLSGKTICITGTLSVSRDEMAVLLERHGAKVVSSISKKTDFLLAGENTGSKLDKATSLGVSVLSEPDVRAMMM